MVTNKEESSAEATTVDTSGDTHHARWRSAWKIRTSSSCDVRYAVPDATAMRGPLSKYDTGIAAIKPAQTTLSAVFGPRKRFVTSVCSL